MTPTKSFILIVSCSLLVSMCNSTKNTYDASGVFEATEIIVSSEATGKIALFSVHEGDDLAQNQVVGAIDSVQLFLKKLQLLTTVRAVESRKPDINKQIAGIEQQIITANNEKRRVESLLKAHAANQKQLDDICAQIALLERQLDAQKSTLTNTNKGIGEESSALEIQIAQLDDQLLKCKIINPIAGTVLGKYAEQGEVTMQGKPLYKIADTKNMFLRVYITAAQLSKVTIGQRIKVYTDYGSNERKEYEGKVTWISAKAEFTPKTIHTKDERANLVYAVKIAVQNSGYIKIGMYGEIALEDK